MKADLRRDGVGRGEYRNHREERRGETEGGREGERSSGRDRGRGEGEYPGIQKSSELGSTKTIQWGEKKKKPVREMVGRYIWDSKSCHKIL